MKAPDKAALHESELATFWFDEHGILCASIKPVDPTLQKVMAHYELIRVISDDKKVCLLSNSSSAKLLDAETRRFIEDQQLIRFKAIAVLSDNAVGKVNTAIFKNINKQAIPIELFSDEDEARAWLKMHL